MQLIYDIIDNLVDFVQKDNSVNDDFRDYLRTINEKCNKDNCMPYVFERRLGEKSIIDLFIEKSKNLSKQVKIILKSLKESENSIFEIKKVLKNGFEMKSLINERTYSVISLKKMTEYRGVGAGQFVVARIIEVDEEYYLINITSVLSSSKKDEAMRFAVAKIVENPSLVYMDNAEMQKKIEKEIKKMHKKFVELFDSTEIFTTNKFADDIIEKFNDYIENGKETDFERFIQKPDKYRFFKVKEFENNYQNFLEKSIGGFSSHKEIYDVAIVFDEKTGLYAIPFLETFSKIYLGENIEGAKNCVKYFFTNNAIPKFVLEKMNEKYSNFVEVSNKYLDTNLEFEELMKKYKGKYAKKKFYSPTTVLYISNTFAKILNFLEEKENMAEIDYTNAKRNDPCPCGSGKKFKNCCLKLIEI